MRILGHAFFQYPQNQIIPVTERAPRYAIYESMFDDGSQPIDSPDPICHTPVDIGRSHPNSPGALFCSPGKHICSRMTGRCPGASTSTVLYEESQLCDSATVGTGHLRGTDGLSRCLEGFSGLSAADSGLNSLSTRPSGIWEFKKIISEDCLCSSNFSCAAASHAEEAMVLPLPPVVSDVISGLDLGSTPEMTLFGTPNRIGPLTGTASAESTERNSDYGGTVSNSTDPVQTEELVEGSQLCDPAIGRNHLWVYHFRANHFPICIDFNPLTCVLYLV